MRRPTHILAGLAFLLLLIGAALLGQGARQAAAFRGGDQVRAIATSALGLTDICLATEARYTRHPAVSDPLAPFMDHPGAIDHFPTGSFWAPPSDYLRVRPTSE